MCLLIKFLTPKKSIHTHNHIVLNCLDYAVTITILNDIPEHQYEALQGPDQENHKFLKIIKLHNFILFEFIHFSLI